MSWSHERVVDLNTSQLSLNEFAQQLPEAMPLIQSNTTHPEKCIQF